MAKNHDVKYVVKLIKQSNSPQYYEPQLIKNFNRVLRSKKWTFDFRQELLQIRNRLSHFVFGERIKGCRSGLRIMEGDEYGY